MHRHILIFVFMALWLSACKPTRRSYVEKSHADVAENPIHGTWKLVRSTAPNAPVRGTMIITTYNKTKLTWVKVVNYNAKGDEHKKSITVTINKKGESSGEIIPNMNDKEKRQYKELQQRNARLPDLEWSYKLSGNRLVIEMGRYTSWYERQL